jgi:hypothetical protein
MMTEYVMHKYRKLLLFATGWLTVIAAILVGQANVAKSSTGWQAANASANAPAYEVISIKPSKIWHPWKNLPDGLSGAATPLSLI